VGIRARSRVVRFQTIGICKHLQWLA
jgi:hypothetical protein